MCIDCHWQLCIGNPQLSYDGNIVTEESKIQLLGILMAMHCLSGSCTHDKQRRNLLRKDCQILHWLQRSSGCLQDICTACDEDQLPMIWDSAANSYAARLMVGDVCYAPATQLQPKLLVPTSPLLPLSRCLSVSC